MKNKARFIAETGLLISLTLVMQVTTKSLGQIVTGSIVNLILAISTMWCGTLSGVIIGAVSPFTAYVLSIGTPFIVIVPFIAMGNVVYSYTIGKLYKKNKILAVLSGAILKFLTLYVLITKIVILKMNIPIEKMKVLSVTFSYPQLITALIGGLVALLVIRNIKKGQIWEK